MKGQKQVAPLGVVEVKEEKEEKEEKEKEEEKEDDQSYNMKVAFIGCCGAGKTSLARQLVANGSLPKNPEPFNDDQMPTVGAAHYETKQTDIRGREVTLSLWDTGGQDRYRRLMAFYTGGANVVCIMYDVTRSETLIKAEKLWNYVAQNLLKHSHSDVVVVLVACKMDDALVDVERQDTPSTTLTTPAVPAVSPRQTLQTGQSFATYHGLLHFTTSAKTGRGVGDFLPFIIERCVDYTTMTEKEEVMNLLNIVIASSSSSAVVSTENKEKEKEKEKEGKKKELTVVVQPHTKEQLQQLIVLYQTGKELKETLVLPTEAEYNAEAIEFIKLNPTEPPPKEYSQVVKENMERRSPQLEERLAGFDKLLCPNEWDVSQVTDMSFLLQSPVRKVGSWRELNALRSFNSPISLWKTTKVTNMNYMFANALTFNQTIENTYGSQRWAFITLLHKRREEENGSRLVRRLPNFLVRRVLQYAFPKYIGGWDTSSVKTMRHMFDGAASFNQPLGQWDVSAVADMEDMFLNASAMTCVKPVMSMFCRGHSSNLPLVNEAQRLVEAAMASLNESKAAEIRKKEELAELAVEKEKKRVEELFR